MTTLSIERSTDLLSAAVSRDGEVVACADFGGENLRQAGWLGAVARFAEESGCFPADRYVVGLGPGSFTGIRAALAAVRGLALPSGAMVRGIPSPFAYAKDEGRVAAVGDARRGMLWVAVFDGLGLETGFKLVEKPLLAGAVPADCEVFSPDGARIGAELAEIFGERFKAAPPGARRIAEIAERHPELLESDPLPVYLTPAVRPPER